MNEEWCARMCVGAGSCNKAPLCTENKPHIAACLTVVELNSHVSSLPPVGRKLRLLGASLVQFV